MKKKIFVASVCAVALIVLLPISGVVGTNIVKSEVEKDSPLFAVRIQRSLNKGNTRRINSNYLGKERLLNLFFLKQSSFQSWIDKAIKIIDAKPKLLNNLLNRLYEIPELVNLLKKHDVSKNYLNKHIASVTNDPSLLRQEMDEAVQILGEQLPNIEPPEPLGFSGQVGCLLVFFLVLFPMLIMIGTMISTLLAVIIPGTLLYPGCFEYLWKTIMEALLEGISQGLTPP